VGASATVDGVSEMDAAVYGIHTGTGAGSVHNSGDMTIEGIVNARMYANTNPSGWSDGFGTTNGTIHSAVDSYGIALGGDLVAVFNDGAITVIARTNPAAAPASREVFVKADGDAQDATTRATLDTTARAGGILGGNGENTLHNSGDLVVQAHANTAPNIIASSDTGGEADVASTATVTSTADGMLGGGLLDQLTNEGTLDVRAEADIDAWVRARTGSTAADADTVNTVDMTAGATGMRAGDVETVLTNSGDIGVTADAAATLSGTASTDLTNSDADSTANATLTGLAEGLASGNGQDSIFSSGAVTVTASADANVTASSNGGDSAHGNTNANGTTTAVAYGIRTGDGTKTVINSGPLTVTASASANTSSYADDDGWIGDWESARSTSNATASATGIETGAGDDVIDNTASITVRGIADAEADADTEDEDRESGISIAQATGHGIQTGGGNDVIINSGKVYVSAEVKALASAKDTTIMMNIVTAGISTGTGNDTVAHYGTIEARIVRDGIATSGIGIDLGDGNDELHLGAESITIGSVDLGLGDDVLSLTGNPIISDIDGTALNPLAGEGSDTLMLIDFGSFAGVPTGFEQAVKSGTGDFELPALPTLEYLRVESGSLVLGSDYRFSDEGLFETIFYSDGGNGRFSVNGIANLDGTINVERRGGSYISDGTRYELIYATDQLTGEFGGMTLPEASPLLSFGLDQGPANLDLVALANPFESVAENLLQQRVARNLDAIANESTGDLSQELGNLQTLSGGFGRALQSFSPDAHQVVNEGATKVIQQSTAMLQSHLSSTRALHRDGADATSGLGVLSMLMSSSGYAGFGISSNAMSSVADSSSGGEFAGRSAQSQAWLLGMVSRGDYDSVDGYTGFEQDTSAFAGGYDFLSNERLILGLSVGHADTDLDMFDVFSEGSVDGWFANAYGSWFTTDRYLDWGLTYNSQDIATVRFLEVGTDSRIAESAHEGDAWSVFVGGGKLYEFERWSLEPFATLQYFKLKEDAFRETGAGSLNQILASRDISALLGEAGVKLGRRLEMDDGTLDWHLLAGINYDFDIDNRSIKYSYAGAPNDLLSLDGRDVSKVSALVGGGIAYFGKRMGLQLEYRGRFNDDYDEQAIAAFISVRF
jgi:uncharacterized protein with beta-barrel porin domain